jgi:hypothetical protein
MGIKTGKNHMSKSIKNIYRDLNGWDWKVTTSKDSRGEISTWAYAMKMSKDGSTYVMSLFTDPCLKLATIGNAIATEKRLMECHNQGIRNFERMRDAGELPVNKEAAETETAKGLPVWAKIIHSGYTENRTPYALLEISTDEFGKGTYKVLKMDPQDPQIYKVEKLRSISSLKGTGYYFIDPVEAYPEAEVLDMLEKAHRLQEEKEKARKEADERAEREEAEAKAAWEAGKPAWARAAIIAQFDVDHSDPMTDYFHSSPDHSKTILLAWSATERNNEQEMRNAVLNHPELAAMTWTKDSYRYQLEESPYRGGWKIRKQDITVQYTRHDIALAMAQGRNFAPQNEPPKGAVETNAANVRIILNERQGGIELHFAGKPDESILSDLKANGFRWARFNKCWYKKDGPSARRVAAKYGTIPGEQENDQDPAAGMIEGEANARMDNWASSNL